MLVFEIKETKGKGRGEDRCDVKRNICVQTRTQVVSMVYIYTLMWVWVSVWCMSKREFV